jgi:hypothetical protein
MPKKHTKDETIAMVEKAAENMATFYREGDFWKGDAQDTREPYSEIIAEYLLNNICLFDRIKTQSRHDHSYMMIEHEGIKGSVVKTDQGEKWIAKSMFRQTYDIIGTVIDYETSLDNTTSDGLGEIDLLSKSQDLSKLYLIELKREDNDDDTLLRCILEIYTYYKIVDHDKLRADFHEKGEIIPVIAVFKNGAQHDQIKKQQNVVKLMKELGVKAVLLSHVGEKQKEGSNKPDKVKVESVNIDGLDP